MNERLAEINEEINVLQFQHACQFKIWDESEGEERRQAHEALEVISQKITSLLIEERRWLALKDRS